jgi:hypothetical protein
MAAHDPRAPPLLTLSRRTPAIEQSLLNREVPQGNGAKRWHERVVSDIPG